MNLSNKLLKFFQLKNGMWDSPSHSKLPFKILLECPEVFIYSYHVRSFLSPRYSLSGRLMFVLFFGMSYI